MTNLDDICSPFANLKIDDYHKLDEVEGRTLCPQCSRSRKYFCYTCYCPVKPVKHLTPYVKLPVQIDIVKHRQEVDGKSTACHAKVISPDDVHIHTYPDIPHFDADRTILLFPGKDSVQLQETVVNSELFDSTGTENNCNNSATGIQKRDPLNLKPCDIVHVDCDNDIRNTNHAQTKSESGASKEAEKRGKVKDTCPDSIVCQESIRSDTERPSVPEPSFDRVIFLDCTWNQTHAMLQDERIQAFRKVELSPRPCHFWRHQKGSPATFLCTIEAVYYFLRDYHDLYLTSPYTGQYDNLLFFFSYLYEKVNHAKKMKALRHS